MSVWIKELDELPTLLSKFLDFTNTQLFCVDMINGFCKKGNLASTRINSIVSPIIDLLNLSNRNNIDHVYLVNDRHRKDALEFTDYPPHCVINTDEEKIISEIENLPFYDGMDILNKDSTSLEPYVLHSMIMNKITRNYVVVGNCTDICVYQLVMSIKSFLNEHQIRSNIIVPANCVNTYDSDIHPGDFFNNTFLYHMMLNGIDVVKKIV